MDFVNIYVIPDGLHSRETRWSKPNDDLSDMDTIEQDDRHLGDNSEALSSSLMHKAWLACSDGQLLMSTH